jgi:hypothetical protein
VPALPEWEQGTPAILCAAGPRAIPVSTAVRAGDHRILFALGRRRETLAALRGDSHAALCLLGTGVAFTAHGVVAVLREEMDSAPSVAALELGVDRVQDHLADGRTEILDGARWRWRRKELALDEERIVAELRRLAGGS